MHQETRSDIFQEKGYQATFEQKHRQKHLTWAKEKITGLLLSGPTSSFQIKVNAAFNWKSRSQSLEEESGEAHNPSCLKSSVKFSTVQG